MNSITAGLAYVLLVAMAAMAQCAVSSTVLLGKQSSMGIQQRRLQQEQQPVLETALQANLLVGPPFVAASLLSQASEVVSSIAGVKVSESAPHAAATVGPPQPPAAPELAKPAAAPPSIAEANKRPIPVPAKTAAATRLAAAAKAGQAAAPTPAVTQPTHRPQSAAATGQKPAAAKSLPSAAIPSKPAVKSPPIKAAPVQPTAVPASKPAAAAKPPTSPAAKAAAARSPSMQRAASADAARFPFIPLGDIADQAASVVGGLLGFLGIKVSGQPGPGPQAAGTPAATAAAVQKPARAEAVPKPAAVVPQVPAGYVPMCEWRSDLEACWVGRQYLLAVSGTPKSFLSKLVSTAAARDHFCSAFRTAHACNEQAASSLMCSWGISSGRGAFDKGCRSMYLAEWDAFAAQPLDGGLGAAPRAAQALAHVGALMCPGSIAQKSQGCSSIYPMDQSGAYIPGICERGTGCAYQPAHHACTTSAPLQGFIALLDPRFVGTCSSVCYLRMLQQCHKAAEQPAASRAAWCGQQPGCSWASGACRPDIYMSKLDQWGPQVAAASKLCGAQKDESACARAAVKGAVPGQQVAKRAAEWVGAPINTGAADAKCPV